MAVHTKGKRGRFIMDDLSEAFRSERPGPGYDVSFEQNTCYSVLIFGKTRGDLNGSDRRLFKA